MSSRDDNGGDWSPDGGSADELPDFPEEWGVIVIPDDLSELSDEVEAIRAELRQAEKHSRWQRLTARPATRWLYRGAVLALRAPVLIISLAVLVTVASLFASAWPAPPRSPAIQRPGGATEDRADSLPALELETLDGHLVPLRADLPAVILLTDGCDCAQLIVETAAAVRPDVAVVTVTSAGPSAVASPSTASRSARAVPPAGATPQAPGRAVRSLLDPTGELRKNLGLGPSDGTAAALLVNRTGDIVREVTRTKSVASFRPDLARI